MITGQGDYLVTHDGVMAGTSVVDGVFTTGRLADDDDRTRRSSSGRIILEQRKNGKEMVDWQVA